MKEEMKTVEEVVALPEAPWITFSIDTAHRELFEIFCIRNQIPFEEVYVRDEEVTYSVRDGIDEQDVYSYILRRTFIPGDLETYDLIRMLFLRRVYWAPQYDYELHIFRAPEDEWLLSHFNDI